MNRLHQAALPTNSLPPIQAWTPRMSPQEEDLLSPPPLFYQRGGQKTGSTHVMGNIRNNEQIGDGHHGGRRESDELRINYPIPSSVFLPMNLDKDESPRKISLQPRRG